MWPRGRCLLVAMGKVCAGCLIGGKGWQSFGYQYRPRGRLQEGPRGGGDRETAQETWCRSSAQGCPLWAPHRHRVASVAPAVRQACQALPRLSWGPGAAGPCPALTLGPGQRRQRGRAEEGTRPQAGVGKSGGFQMGSAECGAGLLARMGPGCALHVRPTLNGRAECFPTELQNFAPHTRAASRFFPTSTSLRTGLSDLHSGGSSGRWEGGEGPGTGGTGGDVCFNGPWSAAMNSGQGEAQPPVILGSPVLPPGCSPELPGTCGKAPLSCR